MLSMTTLSYRYEFEGGVSLSVPDRSRHPNLGRVVLMLLQLWCLCHKLRAATAPETAWPCARTRVITNSDKQRDKDLGVRLWTDVSH
jgi:hypothetical protein